MAQDFVGKCPVVTSDFTIVSSNIAANLVAQGSYDGCNISDSHAQNPSFFNTNIPFCPCPKGSNNINLLTPSGQFGTRLMGGSDAASPRYIFTHLSPFARLLFPDVDDMVSIK